ncbi:GNAT family N-acetyltransferase [Rheinheimera gaetbuli]
MSATVNTEVTTWFMQFDAQPPSHIDWPEGVQLVEAEVASPELSQFMFKTVGGPWRWFSRLSWDYQQWRDYLTQQQVRTWLLWVKGTPAGYIELLQHADQSVEIKFFGLMPQFIGQGLGLKLAQAAIMQAARWQASKIWLHTCSADHPAALKNYQQAGFVLTDTERSIESLPRLNDPRLLTPEFVYSALKYHVENAG